MAKTVKIIVTKTDGQKDTYRAFDRRDAERDAKAMKESFPGKIRDINIKEP
jgi:hypothetical protein